MSNQSAVRHVYALTTALLVGTCLSTSARAANFDVSTEVQLRSVITPTPVAWPAQAARLGGLR
jgi:hypothetical protein